MSESGKLFTADEIKALYAPFPLADHSVREGHKNRDKTKIQWFVYADRPLVQRRLDELFPGEWEFKHIETRHSEGFVTVTAALVIRGVERAFNGGQASRKADDDVDQDVEKGAFTEAFRRCASMWGLGLYLYEMDYAIWTDAYSNYKEAEEARKEALNKFEMWYSRKFGNQSRQQSPAPRPPQAPPPQPDADPLKQEAANLGATVTHIDDTPQPTGGAWSFDFNKLVFACKDVEPISQKRYNTVKKMMDEGAFKDCTSLESAVQLVTARLQKAS